MSVDPGLRDRGDTRSIRSIDFSTHRSRSETEPKYASETEERSIDFQYQIRRLSQINGASETEGKLIDFQYTQKTKTKIFQCPLEEGCRTPPAQPRQMGPPYTPIQRVTTSCFPWHTPTTHTHTHTRSAFSKRRLQPLKHTYLFRSAAALHSFDHRKWDLQNLNSVGAGQIGQGLWTLASISGTIRSGCGSLPTSIGSSIESGANWVLNQTGIGTSVEQT